MSVESPRLLLLLALANGAWPPASSLITRLEANGNARTSAPGQDGRTGVISPRLAEVAGSVVKRRRGLKHPSTKEFITAFAT